MPKPKWATPERQNHLVSLFLRSGGFCVFGGKPCTNPERHHYVPYIEALVKDWIADDREARGYILRLQRQALHRIPNVVHFVVLSTPSAEPYTTIINHCSI